MTDYCTPADLYAYGLPRGALANPARVVLAANSDADAFTLDLHGFSLNDPVSFRAEAGGVLPVPLEPATTYYAIPVSENVFSVAAVADGTAIDLETNGSRIAIIAPLNIAGAITFGSSIVDDALPAHAVPLASPYPPIVVMTAAELAIGKLFAGKGPPKSLSDMVDAAMKRIARWAQGIPLRGENAPADDKATNVATSATVPYSDSRGWNRFGGI